MDVCDANSEVKGVVSYEPGGFVFPEGEVPERIDGLTGGVAGTAVPMEQFNRLTEIPVVIYFGDYIPETPSKNSAMRIGAFAFRWLASSSKLSTDMEEMPH